MSTHTEKLSKSLEILSELIQLPQRCILRSSELSRVHRERLIKAGFLCDIMKGWLLVQNPAHRTGESTLWYANFWEFLALFLAYRFGEAYCLSAESSLSLHIKSCVIPQQVTVITHKSSGQLVKLPFDTSLFCYKDAKNLPSDRNIIQNLQVMTLPEALCRLSRAFFTSYPIESQTALGLIRDPGELLNILLKKGQTTIAGYLVGAYRHMGLNRLAQEIFDTMTAAGHKIRIENPFLGTPVMSTPSRSPYAQRLSVLWDHYRLSVIDNFPQPAPQDQGGSFYEASLESTYINDAYNSLSIEGYQVTPTLLEQLRCGLDVTDEETRSVLAAKGYQLAFDEVRRTIKDGIVSERPGALVERDLARWYRALFLPSVQGGIIQEHHLAGYRSGQVYIQNSRHVPFPPTGLVDSMEMLFDKLIREDHPGVRAVLGHFFFVYIHPYNDGNGRIGRFIMNMMLVTGGYPWVVIPVEQRALYMESLEKASCYNSIVEFTRFIGDLVERHKNV